MILDAGSLDSAMGNQSTDSLLRGLGEFVDTESPYASFRWVTHGPLLKFLRPRFATLRGKLERNKGIRTLV